MSLYTRDTVNLRLLGPCRTSLLVDNLDLSKNNLKVGGVETHAFMFVSAC